MKQCLLAAMLAALVVSPGAAEIKALQFEPRQFDPGSYTILFSESMDQIQPRTFASQSCDFCLKDRSGRFEVRDILFSQTGPIEEPGPQVFLWTTMVIFNAAGYQASKQNTTAFSEEDVRAEFNAD